jgi:hypothetical protein
MNQEDIPKITSGEISIGILGTLSILSALYSELFGGSFALSISFGLLAIALAILVVGKKLQPSSSD